MPVDPLRVCACVQMLEHSVWTVYGRLSYCLYLLHATVLGIITASQVR